MGSEKPKLYYFNAYGRAETARMILKVCDIDFEDVRFEYDEAWFAMKKDFPFGQAPMLKIDGVTLCQSIAIFKYLASKYGLAGDNLLEDAQMDMIAHTINDLRVPFRAIVLDKDPKRKVALREKYVTEELPFWFRNFERILTENNPETNGEDGYFVGKKMSWVDIMFACNMMPITYQSKCQVDLNKVIAPYPKLQALIKRVESHPKISAWIKERPNTEC